MRRYAFFATALLGLPALLAGCSSSNPGKTVDLLNRRLALTLGPEVADNRATVQPLPDGAQVTLLDTAKLPDDTGALDNRTRDPRASIILGMLDPSLMRVSVADTGAGSDLDRINRVNSFTNYMTEYRLGPTLETVEGAAPPPGPAGLSVTIRVVCPARTNWPGYGQGQSLPACD
jgi:hypothetical protein